MMRVAASADAGARRGRGKHTTRTHAQHDETRIDTTISVAVRGCVAVPSELASHHFSGLKPAAYTVKKDEPSESIGTGTCRLVPSALLAYF